MKTSEKFTQVIAAIHEVQQEMEVIQRGETAKVKTAKADYSYKYASFPRIWVDLKPKLKKHGLTLMQPPSFDMSDNLETWIFHSSGEWVMSAMRLIIVRDDPQGHGSAITFARRYAALATLGLVTDDDNDATTQRRADGEMRRDWVRAYTIMAKKNAPDHDPTYSEFTKFIQEVYGKNPNDILAKEHQQVLDTIKAFDVSGKEEDRGEGDGQS